MLTLGRALPPRTAVLPPRRAPLVRSCASACPIEVGYVTDIEGNLAYFDAWVQRSRVLRYADEGVLDLTHPNAYFIYGGDVMDRGDGGLRLARRLVALKKRHPTRVRLLAGNRDLNKVRLTSELSPSEMRRNPRDVPGPHWDPSAPTLHTYLSELAMERGVAGGAAAVDSRVARAQYVLQHTLGCPGTFEGRRRELGLLLAAAAAAEGEVSDSSVVGKVSDAAVVESLVADVEPGGALRAYLEHACIATVLGNTLFVHGALDARSIQLVPSDGTRFINPSRPQAMRPVDGVHEWCDAMNGCLQRGLASHAASPEWDDERHHRGGEVLMALQNKCAMWGRCVVSGSYADGGTITSAAAAARREELRIRLEKEDEGFGEDALVWEGWTSDPRDPIVAEWLLREGIRRVVVGHKPAGDCPATCSSRYTGVEVVSADTSYADVTDVTGLARGASMACVSLVGPSLTTNAARLWGVLNDGREHDVQLATLEGGRRPSKGVEGDGRPYKDVEGDPLVGTEVELDGELWWIKAKVVEGREIEGEIKGRAPKAQRGDEGATYLCCRGAGRKVERRDHAQRDGV